MCTRESPVFPLSTGNLVSGQKTWVEIWPAKREMLCALHMVIAKYQIKLWIMNLGILFQESLKLDQRANIK